jgi:thiosulfate reductase/polysulfide reductase chain A
MCHNECGVLVRVQDGVVKKIEGDLGDPVTGGMMCSKGLATRQYIYHPDRLLHPFRRKGPRGSGQWERISWETALGEIAGNLREMKEKYGPESVAFCTGTYRGWFQVFMRFANAFGSPNWGEPGMAQCMWPRCNGSALTFGKAGTFALKCPDYPRTKCLIVWGENPAATFPLRAGQLVDAKSRGAKIIVVDPRYTATASKADLWLQPRPGTDGALALSMIHTIIEENLFDREFVEKWCLGFEQLRKRAEEYSPKKVSEITWIPSEKIVQAARMYATTKPASLLAGVTIDQLMESLHVARALAILIALTGNVDVPGGNYFKHAFGNVEERELAMVDHLPFEQWEDRLGFDQYPFLCGPQSTRAPGAHMPAVWRAILTGQPYPIRSMFICGSNPIISYANSKMVEEAIQKLEFIAATDLFMNETVNLADVILPAASWLERSELVAGVHSTYDHLLFRQKAIEPLGECQSDVNILSELARRLGFGQYFWKDEQEYLNFLLRPMGMTFQELQEKGYIKIPMQYKKYEEKGFLTPSGKVELFSSTMKKTGFDPLPLFKEPPESPVSTPKLAKEFPYILTTGGRSPAFFHSEFRQVPWLRSIDPDPLVEIHPSTAKKLKIVEGDWVQVETVRGKIRMRARLTEGIHSQVVSTVHGWPGGANDNILTDNKVCASAIGSTPLRGLLATLCRITKEP